MKTSRLKRSMILVLIVLIAVQTTGCYSWNPTTVPGPGGVIKPGTVLEITTKDRRQWTLAGISLRHDSLIGTTVKGTPLQVGIPIATIISTRVRKSSPVGIAVPILVVGGILLLVVQAASDRS